MKNNFMSVPDGDDHPPLQKDKHEIEENLFDYSFAGSSEQLKGRAFSPYSYFVAVFC